MKILVLCMVLAVSSLLWAEYKKSRFFIWITKPLASSIFIYTVFALESVDSPYKRWIQTALVLSWIGDVLLIRSQSKLFFQLGLVSFLLAHIAFIGAFFQIPQGFDGVALGGAFVAVAGAGFFVSRWLMPYVKRQDVKMAGPVWAYICVISVMVASAAGFSFQIKSPSLFLGAVVFYLSDISVARDQFVQKSFINKLWGLPFYYAAQMILAYTVTTIGRYV